MTGLGKQRQRLPAQCPCCGVLYSNFRSGWTFDQAHEHVAATSQFRPSRTRILNEMWRLKQDEWAQHLAACQAGQDPNCPPGQGVCAEVDPTALEALEPAFYPGGYYWDQYQVQRCRGPGGRFAPKGACSLQDDAPAPEYAPEEFADDDW